MTTLTQRPIRTTIHYVLLTPEQMRIARQTRHQLWIREYRRHRRRTVWAGLVYWGIWVAVLVAMAAAMWRG